MKPEIKKLKSCLYSKSSGPTGFFARESVQPTKQVCDHPEKKMNWAIAVCADCTVYLNRTMSRELPTPAETPKRRSPRKPKPTTKLSS